jgi:hypothetical protein
MRRLPVMLLLVPLLAGLFLVTRDSKREDPAAYAPRIDPADFTTVVDNPYFPLMPGTRWVYEGTGDDGERERKVVEFTTDTRTVMGVTCVVVRDTVTADGELIEDTFDWYAQDGRGNVWYFGEDTTEYENGKPVNHNGAWRAGAGGAQPGIVMKGSPAVGDHYRQEYLRGEAEDMADVIALDRTTAVPFGSFDRVLVTKDYTPLEPGMIEHKFYAAGVGTLREVKVEGGNAQVELVEMTRADASEKTSRSAVRLAP